jgi:hypothetical protein
MATHRIRPQWPDIMVYEDEQGRAIEFNTRSMAEPPHVVLPSVAQWTSEVPGWAHDQRDTIAERLRKAGCVLAEQDGRNVRTFSPDGMLRVDEDYQHDERSGPWETIQLIELASGKSLAFALNHDTSELPLFPQPGVAVLSMQDRAGLRHRVEIDAKAGAFRMLRMQEAGPPEPLSRLDDRLGLGPSPTILPEPARSAMWCGLQAVLALASLVFVLGGAWMLLTAATAQERWTGLAGVLFFGACGVASLTEVRSHMRQRRAKPGRHS